MMGWVAVLAAAIVTLAALWLAGFPRSLWRFALAAVMLGGAAYAWLGQPTMAGSPVERQAEWREIDQEIVGLRQAFFGRFGPEASSYAAGDALSRSGAGASAASVYLGAIRSNPNSQAMWTALGDTLVQHDGALSPAARLAFDRAIAINPANPGPWFFAGLAHVRDGDLAGARARWAKSVELTPPSALRDAVQARLTLLDQLIAAQR